MPQVLSRDQVERYHEDGILFPIPTLSPAEIARFREAFYDLEARLGGKPSARQLSQTHLYFRWAYDLATYPRVLDAVENILRHPDLDRLHLPQARARPRLHLLAPGRHVLGAHLDPGCHRLDRADR